MKLNTKFSAVEVENENPVNQFKMLVNEKSFSIIISGIYSRKIDAIIREYSCNAVDSHKMAGYNIPFDIHLPTYKEPYFYVEDYGLGLDEDDIVNVFTVAFASTKDNTNVAVGQIGIGAMSGFCYNTKSFTVTSKKNGKKYIYHCFINENGVPAFTKLLEEDTDECNGVKVELVVNPSDIYAFKSSAKSILRWLEIKPNFIGEEVELYQPRKIIEGDGWYFSDDSDCYVLMGGVLYSVDDTDPALQKYSDYIDSPIIIEAEMGSVDFQPSREGLQYTVKTIAFLRKTFERIEKDIANKISEKIESSDSLWQARVAFNEIKYTFNRKIRSLINPEEVKWNGKSLDYEDRFYNNYDFSIRHFIGDSYRKSPKQYHNKSILSNSNTIICVADENKGVVGKINHFCSQSNITVHLFTPDKDKLDELLIILEKELGCTREDIKFSSDLPSPPKKTFSRNKIGKISKWVYSYRVTYSWVERDLSKEDITQGTYYYVLRKAYKFLDGSVEKKPKELKKYIDVVNDHLKGDVDVYAMSPKESKNLPSNWVEFTSYAKSIIDNKKKECQEYLDYSIKEKNVKEYIRKYYSEINTLRLIKDDLPQDHKIVSLLNEIDNLLNSDLKEPSGYDTIISILDLQGEDYEVDLDMSVIEEYPLFGHYNNYYGRPKVPVDHFVLYILGVDSLNKEN